MRALLVTSELTYVPKNYIGLFESVLKLAASEVAGLVLLENASLEHLPKLGRDILGLGLLGCRGISAHLLRNFFELRLRHREKLFEARGLPVYRTASMNDP